jgi:hypothetical protein
MSVANVGYPVYTPQFSDGTVVQLNAIANHLTTALNTDSGNQGLVLPNNVMTFIPNSNMPSLGAGLAFISGIVSVPDNTTPMDYIQINTDNNVNHPPYLNYAYCFPYSGSDTRFAFTATVPWMNPNNAPIDIGFKSTSNGAADSTIQSFQVVYYNFGVLPYYNPIP